ncbi:hypothetical protein UB45_08775 [Terrabacter sp. 28]|nr:hypothetical protein UB45_08775 [Terrabacter sp. 28]
MSRVHEERRTGAVAGADALPTPTGRPDELHHAARTLDRAAARARATTTVAGTLGPRLRAVWTGDAASAAEAEAHQLGLRSRGVVDALTVAAHSLRAYAVGLEIARRRALALQGQWDALELEHAVALVGVTHSPDLTGALGAALRQRADEVRLTGRLRLSRAYRGVIDELETVALRSSRRLLAVSDLTVPHGSSASPSAVRAAVTGGMWFADGMEATRRSRDVALADGALLRRLLSSHAGGRTPAGEDDVAAVVARLRAHAEDPVYAQALVEEVGTDGLGRLALQAGDPSSSVSLDTVRQLLAVLGSVVITAAQQSAPAGTDPRTRARLASGSALLADDLVAGATRTVSGGASRQRAGGYWLLGQMMAGARLSGDSRPLPARLVRRAAAATATAEVAETRDADAELRHGTTIHPAGDATFASWFDRSDFGGDALHLLLTEVGDDPAEQAALLAEPLPASTVAGGALANSRGDRLTVGEHLVRRWITFEANGTQTHHDLRLETDADLTRLLPSISTATTVEAAETRARLMLEISRTSDFAMREASTTRIYDRGPAVVEQHVVEWLSAMHASVDRALGQPLDSFTRGYSADTADGQQPMLDARELSGVVAALAVDTGTGLHAREPATAYESLLRSELQRAEQAAASRLDVMPAVARLGFFDQAASAALVAVARRQDELNKAAWEGLAEAVHVVDEIRRGGPAGLVSMAQTYASGGSLRTAEEDLLIAAIRSDVELEQTELDDERRAALLAGIEALVGRASVGAAGAFTRGAGRAPTLPTAEALRQAREDEIRAAWNAVRDGGTTERLKETRPKGLPEHAISRADGTHTTSPAEAADRLTRAHPTGSALKDDVWHRSGSWVTDEIRTKGTAFVIVGGDGVKRTLIQLPGNVNGVDGRFEWIIDGDRITHQMFVRGGGINGVPIKP